MTANRLATSSAAGMSVICLPPDMPTRPDRIVVCQTGTNSQSGFGLTCISYEVARLGTVVDIDPTDPANRILRIVDHLGLTPSALRGHSRKLTKIIKAYPLIDRLDAAQSPEQRAKYRRPHIVKKKYRRKSKLAVGKNRSYSDAEASLELFDSLYQARLSLLKLIKRQAEGRAVFDMKPVSVKAAQAEAGTIGVATVDACFDEYAPDDEAPLAYIRSEFSGRFSPPTREELQRLTYLRGAAAPQR
jgi:hypothetical protein